MIAEASTDDETKWWRGAVIYQIYPRSFQDSNADGVGDLNGITQRLPYIKALGVDAIWICPFYASPMHDGGYDVSDYRAVHPLFGTLDDFDALIGCAHQHGLKVMIDLVLSHTSNEHAWFLQSSRLPEGKYGDWYVWADPLQVTGADGSVVRLPPNNWVSLFGGSSWQWHADRQQYYLHNFWPTQPDLNFHSAAVQDAVLDVVRFWLDRGVDGFRIDTANYFFHDTLLRNNPPAAEIHARADGLPAGTEYAKQQHVHDKSQPENLKFLARLRSLMDTYPNRTLLAEIGDDDALERMAEYTAGSQRFHMAYSFHLLEDNFDLPTIVQLVAQIDHRLSDGWPCWSLSNHDVPRVITRWFPDATSERQARMSIVLLAFLLSLRGSVCLYQGDELGLDEADVPFEQLQDAFGIAHWPKFKGRDGCRTPMPWTAREPLCDFSSAAQGWLPIGRTHVEKNAEAQSKLPASVLSTTQRLLAWRQQSAALKLGSFAISTLEGGGLCIRRSYQDEHIVVLLNFSTDELRINDPALQGAEVIAELTAISGQWEGATLRLPPSSATYLKQVGINDGDVQLKNGDKL